MITNVPAQKIDPLQVINSFWPHVRLFDKQAEAVYSCFNNVETFIPAGNMLGKDFLGGLVVLTYFLTRQPCRIVTTSAKDDHLRVLWGEIHKFIQESVVPLDYRQGGPLIINQRELKRFYNGQECKISYVKGMVASTDSIAAMQGHHVAKTGDGIPRTMFFTDESSSVEDEYMKMGKTWANTIVCIGNNWPCTNFWYKAQKGDDATDDPGGDLEHAYKPGVFQRKIIKIKAEDSPNVKIGLREEAKGKKPSFEMVIPGVKDYEEYLSNRRYWDKIQQCVSLDAEFYEGEEIKLYPEAWLELSKEIADILEKRVTTRRAESLGVDGGEGRSKTVWTFSDKLGVIKMYEMNTFDTSIIIPKTIALASLHNLPPEKWWFDRGGGGKQYVDLLRKKGYNCNTVSFGEAATDPKKFRKGMKSSEIKVHEYEDRTIYKNRRAEMYGWLRDRCLNPNNQQRTEEGKWISGGFGIPREYTELYRQLKPLPLLFDAEGVIYLPPKDKKDPNSKEKTITELLGKSPDEADSLVLSVFGLFTKSFIPVIGGFSDD